MKLAVDAIWHSDKERAQQTGELLAGAVWARDRLVQPEGLGPKDSEKNEIVEFRGVVCVERRETNLAGELEQFLKTGREVKEYGRDIAKAEQLEL